MKRNILISIKPQYSWKIFTGTKTIELRKRFPSLEDNTIAYVYESSPTQAIVGVFTIEAVYQYEATEKRIEEFWYLRRSKLGMSKDAYLAYFKDAKILTAIHIENPCRFEKPLFWTDIEKVSRPPQSFYYLDEKSEFARILRNAS